MRVLSKPQYHLGITLGDPSGIGYEILLKWLMSYKGLDKNRKILHLIENQNLFIYLFGNSFILEKYIKKLNLPIKIEDTQIRISQKILNYVKIVPIEHEMEYKSVIGKGSKISGEIALNSIEVACQWMKLKKIDVMVTLPIHKKSIMLQNPSFIGHTEYLQSVFKVNQVMMCFLSPIFDLALLTSHIPIKEVPILIEDKLTLQKRIKMSLDFQASLGDMKPLYVLGLNPHAGEDGFIGKEDLILKEVIDEYKRKGYKIEGPTPSDTAFIKVLGGEYRTVVASYHDQGLIPMKTLSKGTSVNYTYGLPFVRTSVDHGTAFDIAGLSKASERPFHEAILKAVELMVR